MALRGVDWQSLSRNLAGPPGAVFFRIGFKCLLAFRTAKIIRASLVFSLEGRLFHLNGHFAHRAHSFLGHFIYLLHFMILFNTWRLISAIRKCLIFGFEKPEADSNNGRKKISGDSKSTPEIRSAAHHKASCLITLLGLNSCCLRYTR